MILEFKIFGFCIILHKSATMNTQTYLFLLVAIFAIVSIFDVMAEPAADPDLRFKV